jgi:hypothetical protein
MRKMLIAVFGLLLYGGISFAGTLKFDDLDASGGAIQIGDYAGLTWSGTWVFEVTAGPKEWGLSQVLKSPPNVASIAVFGEIRTRPGENLVLNSAWLAAALWGDVTVTVVGELHGKPVVGYDKSFSLTPIPTLVDFAAELGSAPVDHVIFTVTSDEVYPQFAMDDLDITVQSDTEADVGYPSHAGSVTFENGNTVVKGGGSDIWNQWDAFHYYYFPRTGDFDCVVRLRSLVGPDWWSKAELMVREGSVTVSGNLVPNPGDRFFAAMATQGWGANIVAPQWRDTRDGSADWPDWPVAEMPPLISPFTPEYPDSCWLRLQRVGDVFVAYQGYDGVNWTTLLSSDVTAPGGQPFDSTVLVGLAVTAHNDSTPDLATAVFSDFQIRDPAPPVNQVHDLAVNAAALWVPAGIALAANDTVSIAASGQWTYMWEQGMFGPDGAPSGSPDIGVWPCDTFFSGAAHGSLIAYVGSDPYQAHWGDGSCGAQPGFFPQSSGYWAIGTSADFVSDRAGTLWLSINDSAGGNNVRDNYGTLSTEVNVVKWTIMSPTPSVLGSPNHKMVDIVLDYVVSPNLTPTVAVTSNEPQNGLGDGDQAPDWQVLDAHHLRLRAERSGTGTGRVYTITVTCKDSSGGVVAFGTAQVFVPKSQGKQK